MSLSAIWERRSVTTIGREPRRGRETVTCMRLTGCPASHILSAALCSRVVRHGQAAQHAGPSHGWPRPVMLARQVQLLLVARGGYVVQQRTSANPCPYPEPTYT